MQTARRRGTTWAVAASILAHVALLVVVVLQRPTLALPPAEPAGPPEAIIPILLLPKVPPPAAGGARQPGELRLHRRPQRLAEGPLPVAPLPSESAPIRAAERPEPSPLGPSAPAPIGPPGPDLRLALRHGAAGCADASVAGMSRAERERCEEQLGRGVASAPYLPAAIAPRIRAYYDAVAEAKKPDGPPTPQMAPGRLGVFDVDNWGTNGHGPGVGCHIAFGPGEKPKGPPHALSLGPCYIEPPKGPLSAEVDVTPP